jgi:hypothetical protein
MQIGIVALATAALVGSNSEAPFIIRVTGEVQTCKATVKGTEISSDAELMASAGSKKQIVLDTDGHSAYPCVGNMIGRLQAAGFDVLRITVNGQSAPEPPPPLERRDRKFELLLNGGGLGLNVDESVAFIAAHRPGSARWLVRREVSESNWCGQKVAGQCKKTTTSHHDWIDQKYCPALAPVIARLIHVQTVERRSSHHLVSDTPLVSLVTFDHGGFMRSERISEYEGALAGWWQSAEKQLKPCWTDRQPPEG